MKLGIVGLPNVGKSTLFNAITKAGAEAANYPFCTIEPNVGVVTVPDKRLEVLTDIYKARKTIYTTIEFCDIAGLVKGASKGEGLGNKFLGHIREVSAIVHVVRCFANDNIVHVNGHVDPLDDIETINTELIFADLEVLERAIAKLTKSMKADKSLAKQLDLLERVKAWLETGKSARAMELNKEEGEIISGMDLLTFKPVIYVANVSEDDVSSDDNEHVQKVSEFAASEGAGCVKICAEIEAEMAELDAEEREMFLEDLGISESGLDQLIKASYSLLNLISYLTAGEPEVRAWTITKGTKAPQHLLRFPVCLMQIPNLKEMHLQQLKKGLTTSHLLLQLQSFHLQKFDLISHLLLSLHLCNLNLLPKDLIRRQVKNTECSLW